MHEVTRDPALLGKFAHGPIHRVQTVVNNHAVRTLRVEHLTAGLPRVYGVAKLDQVLLPFHIVEIEIHPLAAKHELIQCQPANADAVKFERNDVVAIQTSEHCLSFPFLFRTDEFQQSRTAESKLATHDLVRLITPRTDLLAHRARRAWG